MAERVLLVTERPELIEYARGGFRAAGLETVACLGPGQPCDCLLDSDGRCSLAARARIALVDLPTSGRFGRYDRTVPVTDYAERLAKAYPELLVLMWHPADDRLSDRQAT